MEWQLLQQFGISGISLGVLFFTLKESNKRMKQQDDFMEVLVNNHFQHSIEAMKELTTSVTKLADKIK
mgnify:CR=1 FL=1